MVALAPAFAEPVTASQAVFRAVMNATARPGTQHCLAAECAPPAPLGRGMAALALTLLDYETPVWLDPALAGFAEVTAWLRFHTGAPITKAQGEAAFALLSEAAGLPPFGEFALGSAEYPDRATTLVIEVERFEGEALQLAGPGIAGVRSFSASPLPADFRERMRENRALFPRGVDLIFVCGETIAALPRSTRLVEKD